MGGCKREEVWGGAGEWKEMNTHATQCRWVGARERRYGGGQVRFISFHSSQPQRNSFQPQRKECSCHTFLDGCCSTVQGLLVWFEVDLGFTELLFIQIDLCVMCVFVLYI